MYTLDQPLSVVKGIGPKLAEQLADHGVETIKDLLLFLPLRYEDRSQRLTISELLLAGRDTLQPVNDLITVKATLKSLSNQFKGRFKSIQRATVFDETGQLNVIWFNNRFVMDSLKKGSEYYFSGKINDRGFLLQPKVEPVKDDTLHTNRLVPIYSSTVRIKDGTLRRILKGVIDELTSETTTYGSDFLPLTQSLQQLHFPDTEAMVVKARERLALEELLGIIRHSEHLKAEWKKEQGRVIKLVDQAMVITQLPFELTQSQQQATDEILADLKSGTPMNRLLIGDVGAGKTVVAGLAAHQVLTNGLAVALIAPTQMLAEQHATTFQKLFPELPIELVTAKTKKNGLTVGQPTLYIGTHALINRLEKLQPGLIVYDEQHRFGVGQRSTAGETELTPHVLTMSATPIPRSLMLTLFSHLHVSYLTELPPGRLPVKTWLVPQSKRSGALQWVAEQGRLTLIVCPFIDPSHSEALENVASATETYDRIKADLKAIDPGLTVGLLHGRLKPKAKAEIIADLYAQKINVLVTTPIVEVGVDLPTADIIVIESAERFGLASLHQLRGRVGRAGQQAYCLLFTTKPSQHDKDRLQVFTQETNGIKLAEFDLKNRGAGNIFGTQQHGFDNLRFADWANLELITKARQVYDQVKPNPEWQPFLEPDFDQEKLPSAN